ncbi:MAG: hypothetical protein IKD25_09160 [Bacteroidaceae bacterium]|nr:hypothetical protein [Bacteroidaceae bacterium]
MNNPRLWLSAPSPAFRLQFMTKRQQLIKSLYTMDYHRFTHQLRHSYLSTESCYLDCQLSSTHFV